MRLVTGSILLITMISPFLSGIDLSEFNFDNNAEYDVSGISHKTVAYAYKTEIFEILERNDIDNTKITINTATDENNSIIVESAIILFDKTDKSKIENIKNSIKETLDISVETEIKR